jgi:hypothetical protein
MLLLACALLLCVVVPQPARADSARVRDGEGDFISARLVSGAMNGMQMPPTAGQRRTAAVLDPTTIPKYVTDLPIPTPYSQVRAWDRLAAGALRCCCGRLGTARTAALSSPQEGPDYYEISVKQKTQQVLPEGFPETTVFAYGPTGAPLSEYGWPAKTIEAQVRGCLGRTHACWHVGT